MNDFNFANGKNILTDGDNWDRSPDMFNWSVAEYDKAHAGDRFIFIKVGYEDRPVSLVSANSHQNHIAEKTGQVKVVKYTTWIWTGKQLLILHRT